MGNAHDQLGTSTAEMAFGRVLRELRQRLGISQEELGFRSGYDRTYISMLERGKKSPSLRTIMRLAQHLDTTGSRVLARVEKAMAGAEAG
jgi:transcriptional regulator with XRE-family HTH domain